MEGLLHAIARPVGGRGRRAAGEEAIEQEGEGEENEEEVEGYRAGVNEAEEEAGINWRLGEKEEIQEIEEDGGEETEVRSEEHSEERGDIREGEDTEREVGRGNQEASQGMREDRR